MYTPKELELVAGLRLVPEVAPDDVPMLHVLAAGTQKWAVFPAVGYFGAILAAGVALFAVGVKAVRRVGVYRQERARYERGEEAARGAASVRISAT